MDPTIHWRKHCNFYRLAKNCSIYLYTTGGCHDCAQNLKERNYKEKKSKLKRPKLNDNIQIL